MRCPRRVYLLLVLPLMILSCVDRAQLTSRELRHVILITVDTLRPDRIGAYGYARAESPNLDALANASIRFDNAYAHSSMTVPSFASMLTGCLPSRHQIYQNGGRLDEGIPTVATRLHDAGFATAAFLGNYALRRSRGFDRGFDVYTDEFRAKEAFRDQPENLAGPITDQAIDWLSNRDPEERLFLWVHYQEPHGPYTPPRFRPVGEGENPRVLTENATNSGWNGIPKYQWLGHGRMAEYESRYDGEITEFDRHLGRLLMLLRKRGILDKSALLFASDHGEAFGEEDIFCAHGEGLGEALLRVPLLLRLPGQPGSVRADRVRLIDLSPTLLQSVGVRSGECDGTNLLLDRGDRPVVAQVRSIGGKRWRSYREGRYEIRQLDAEAPVLRGAAGMGTREVAEIRARMIMELRARAPWPQSKRTETPLTEREEDALRALGYLE